APQGWVRPRAAPDRNGQPRDQQRAPWRADGVGKHGGEDESITPPLRSMPRVQGRCGRSRPLVRGAAGSAVAVCHHVLLATCHPSEGWCEWRSVANLPLSCTYASLSPRGGARFRGAFRGTRFAPSRPPMSPTQRRWVMSFRDVRSLTVLALTT